VSNGLLKVTGEVAPQGGLYEKAQYMSFPNLMALSFSSAGTDITFTQPMVPGDGSGRLSLVNFDAHPCPGHGHMPQMRPFPLQVNPEWYTSINTERPFHNLGIPGLRIRDIEDRASLSELPAVKGMIRDSIPTYTDWITSSHASFFSMWMGMEDLLSWVYLGTPAQYPPLDGPEFEAKVTTLLQAFEAGGATHGVIANIPDITRFPFFREVGITIVDARCETHKLFMETLQLPRELAEGELVLLPAARRISPEPGYYEEGSHNNPLPPKFVLDKQELSMLRGYITAYNQAIETAIGKANQGKIKVALVDMHSFLEEVASGIQLNGDEVNSEYLYGGFFSVDGLYPTGRGNALIANKFVTTINESFGTNIPMNDPNEFPTVPFP
jgi:hypothetical protein